MMDYCLIDYFAGLEFQAPLYDEFARYQAIQIVIAQPWALGFTVSRIAAL